MYHSRVLLTYLLVLMPSLLNLWLSKSNLINVHRQIWFGTKIDFFINVLFQSSQTVKSLVARTQAFKWSQFPKCPSPGPISSSPLHASLLSQPRERGSPNAAAPVERCAPQQTEHWEQMPSCGSIMLGLAYNTCSVNLSQMSQGWSAKKKENVHVVSLFISFNFRDRIHFWGVLMPLQGLWERYSKSFMQTENSQWVG